MASSEAFHHRGHYGSLNTHESSLQPQDHHSRPPFQLGALDSSDNLNDEAGSSGWIGASFNLTSSIVGAGCIGLGGAIAQSGGLISLVALIVFAVLSKYSFDLLLDLTKQVSGARTSTYERLAYLIYGNAGQITVIVAKGLYSFGCLVAYIVIVKDNFAIAMSHLLFNGENSTGAANILTNPYAVTIFFSTSVMLPLCMLRDVTPLEKFSALKITILLLIVVIVLYLFLTSETSTEPNFVHHWLVIGPGVFESMGTFVFAFVAQHTIHLVYQSLKPSAQQDFSKTTTLGTILSTLISMAMGFFVYMTFWEKTSSAMFNLYPPSAAVDTCRILLCMSMLLTYPFPFLTVRELIILLACANVKQDGDNRLTFEATTEPLVLDNIVPRERNSWLIPGSDRQLKRNYHVGLTVLIWLVTLILALGASSLGAVLNLTGAATGTVISFILPAMFSFKVRGHTILGSLLFLLGGSVGLIGTYYSTVALFR